MTYIGPWERALAYLTSRPRSAKQVYDYLNKKGYDLSEIDETIERLLEANYLNDYRFAEGFARARSEGKLHGRYSLRRDLLQRGVDELTVEKAMEEVFSYIDESEILDRAFSKWIRINGKPADQKEKKRLNDYLFRLGFEPQAIIGKIRSIGETDEE